jgi:hypothetical protein
MQNVLWFGFAVFLDFALLQDRVPRLISASPKKAPKFENDRNTTKQNKDTARTGVPYVQALTAIE